MRVEIYLNENTRSSFVSGYKEDDPLERVYDGEQPDEMTLERIYESNQNLDGEYWPWYEGRSLSKGDVIVVDGDAYAIDSVGFKAIHLIEAPTT